MEITDCEDDQSVVRSEASFFAEWEMVKLFINDMCEDNWEQAWKSKWEYVTTCLLVFQEQPTLLGPYLESIIVPLTMRLINILQQEENTAGRCQRMKSSQFHAICKVLQLFCRIRGYKHVIKFFPHEVSHIEMCMFALRSQDKGDHANWETRYVMLLWLCMLCLIPFDICSMDSSLSTLNTSATSQTGAPPPSDQQSRLVLDIISVCKEHLAESGPTREAAYACLSALFTRPDMESGILGEFMRWTCSRLDAWAAKGANAEQELNRESFQLIGLLHCLSQIFKKGHRNNVLPFAAMALGPCLAISEQSNQTLVRKLLIKVFQRIALTFLPPREASWRYQRGSRSLLTNLAAAAKDSSTVSATMDGALAVAGEGGEEDGEEEDVDVPAELEDIVEKLLCALKDKDTVVRWSAAKGIGRITMRLPLGFGDDVVGAVVDVFSDQECESSWHGGCLAMAELSRRGLLLPERLVDVVPIVVKAMHFDIMRGQHSVGAHVRDSACYVCWAFARAYAPKVMKPFVSLFTEAMLLASLFDREINCRRAASAAFQENVGRQGNENFPHGIEVIAVADYFTLGNRNTAYLTIAPAVAAMNPEFNRFIVHHLSTVKLSHWDVEIRSLAAKALGKLATLDAHLAVTNLREVMSQCMSSQPTVRHGSLLAVAEVVSALCLTVADSDASELYAGALSEEVVDEIVQLVPKLDKARMYRGRGGEQLREASCQLVEAIGKSQLTMPVKAQVALVEFLNENIKQPHEHIQRAAAAGLRQMLFSYFPVGATGPSERLQSLTVLKYLEGLKVELNVAVTRGYALALGALPPKLLRQPQGRVGAVFACLGEVADTAWRVAGEPDVETRRNAVESIVELGDKLTLVGVLSPASGGRSADCVSVADVVDLLLRACEDYSVDKRGDTGSWCRIAGMKGLQRILVTALRRPDSSYPQDSAAVPVDSANSEIVVGSHVLTAYGHALVTAVGGDQSEILRVSFPPGSGASSSSSSASVREIVVRVKGVELVGQSRPTTDGEFIVRAAADRRVAMLSAHTGEGLATLTKKTAATATADDSFASRWDPQEVRFSPIEQDQVHRIVSALLKQLGEKLDVVREVAGGVLVSLVRSTDPFVAILPDRKVLEGGLLQIEKNVAAAEKASGSTSANGGEIEQQANHLKWTQPKYVYTFLTGVLDSNLYFAPVVGGLVISIGGLSEGIGKESLAALLNWCNMQKASKNMRDLSLLATTLVDIFRQFSRQSRVVMPLLKCLSALLRNGIFDFLYSSSSGPESVGLDLHRLVLTELNKCGEIAKIRAGIDLYLLLLMFDDPVRPAALKSLVTLTGHKYPKVRKYAAEQLYLVMISDPFAVGPSREEVAALIASDLESDRAGETRAVRERRCSGIAQSTEDSEQAMGVLTCTLWEDDDVATARGKRAVLGDLLHVEIKTVAASAEGGSGRQKNGPVEDKLDSYGALVREAGKRERENERL